MNETTARPPAPVHAARVRLLGHAIARKLLAIPADASKRSRTMRIVALDRQIRQFAWMMTRMTETDGGVTVIVDDEREWRRWFRAVCDAWEHISVDLADDDLAAFLWPGEMAVAE